LPKVICLDMSPLFNRDENGWALKMESACFWQGSEVR
jgi:hypothetical protein